MDIIAKLAKDLSISPAQVTATIQLLDQGATVPFIARYRKETTGGLSDTQLRDLETGLGYLRNLNDRRQVILKSISEQGKLTPDLEQALQAADNQTTLEDLYLPYKPKRRTKAQIAKEAGLEALANSLLTDPSQAPEELAQQFINAEHNIHNPQDALSGASHILLERFAEEANLLALLRDLIWQHGQLHSVVMKDKEEVGNKFSDYFNYQEALTKIPSHRVLALLRGQREEVLRLSLHLNDDIIEKCHHYIHQTFNISHQGRPADSWLIDIVSLTWRLKLYFKFEVECLVKLREQAEADAVRVFANNLKNLLMTSPAGSRITMGLDPGFRTGVKGIIVDGTGKLLTHFLIYPHAPQNQWDVSIAQLAKYCEQYDVELISIGNGTASRETGKLVSELKQKHSNLHFTSVTTSEAGASVYSASAYAAQEFPDLDVSYRGAVSIARRLQDPLAELIKIDPKSIGVGQYQHDVNQHNLSKALRSVMEDCVNAVGVDVNTASVPLLSCIAGLNETVAKNIITYREKNGAYSNRSQLKSVSRFGDKAFEQAAGFLRIMNGDNPLDHSAVHPEAYSVVEAILTKQGKSIDDIIGNSQILKTLKATEFVTPQFGLPTVIDIINELEKPGRDPRPEFKMPTFNEQVHALQDLKVGMILEGVIMNVASFGAFVDIGVHQDGLVHVSALANHFVKDPNTVVKVGDIVKVKVLEVDIARKRIQLTMRLQDEGNTNTAVAKTSEKPKKDKPGNTFAVTLKDQMLNALKKR